jgi:DNA mismatch repair protein MutS2
MNRALVLPALVLLDEVGAGTDPVEGGALGIAVIDHFRPRGAHLVATTHYDSLKSYASTTDGVESAAFGFNPENVRTHVSSAVRIAGTKPRHRDRGATGMPASVVAQAART